MIRLYLKVPENLCVSFARTGSGLYIYHLFVLWQQIKIKRSPDEQPFKSVWELVHLNIVITKRGVYFSHVWRQWGVWNLIPRRISPCSGSFLGYIYELAYYVGVNLGLDWPPLVSKFHITHTPTRPLALPPLDLWKIWTSRFRCNNINYNYNIFKGKYWTT